MTDSEISSDEGKPPTFLKLRARARTLERDGFENGERIMKDARSLGLEKYKIRILISDCAKSLGVDASSFAEIMHDMRETHPRHGRLASKKQVSDALAIDIAPDRVHLRISKGLLFAYDRQTGAFTRRTDRALESMLLEGYSEHVTNPAARREVIDLLKNGIAAPDSDAFSNAPTGLAVSDQFLAWDQETNTFSARPHSPENLARSHAPISYDPAAQAPRFRAALMRVLGNRPEAVNALLQFMACTIFGLRPSQDSVRGCLLLQGAPRTGKSTLIELLRMFVVAEQVAHLPPNLWGKPEHLASLASATLCVCTELDPRARLKGAIVKPLLSGELVNARYMRQTIFSFVCAANHVWAANELPRIDEINPSLARRFLCIRMAETLSDEEAQTSLIDIAIEEESGVLNLLLDAFTAVQQAGRYDLTPESNLIVSQMQLGSDVAALFVRNGVVSAPGKRLWTSQIKRALASFTSELGMEPEIIHSGTLHRVATRLYAEYGAVRRTSTGRPFYEGVTLLTPLPDADDAAPSTAVSPDSGPRLIPLDRL